MDLETVYREERPCALATLIRLLRDFDLAEEMLQEAVTAALEQWPRDGAPRNPCAWLVSAARHKAIDGLRREKSFAAKSAEIAYLSETAVPAADVAEEPFPDDLLRLIFTCCHPALALETLPCSCAFIRRRSWRSTMPRRWRWGSGSTAG
jgi:RNA polymerase sigma-70 factor, ECF subfamily